MDTHQNADGVWGRLVVIDKTLYGRFTFMAHAIIAELPQNTGRMHRLIISPGAIYFFEAASEEDVRLLAAEEDAYPTVADAATKLREKQAFAARRRTELPLVRRGIPLLTEHLIAAGCLTRDEPIQPVIQDSRDPYTIHLRNTAWSAASYGPGASWRSRSDPNDAERMETIVTAIAQHLGLEPQAESSLFRPYGWGDVDTALWDAALALGREMGG